MNNPILELSKHTGMILAFTMQPIKLQGEPAKLRPIYMATQRHCLLFGWWSLMSLFIINPATIILNAYNWHKYKKQYIKFSHINHLPIDPTS